MCNGICTDCILQTDSGFCYSSGEPEDINGFVTSCDYLRRSKNKDFNKGFIDGFTYACIKHDKILEKYRR